MNQKVFRYALLTALALFLPVFVTAQERGLDERINDAFKPVADWWAWLVFYPLFEGIPIVLVLLISGAAFFTIAFGFVNIRRFGTAINVVRGKYDDIDAHAANPKHAEPPDTKATEPTISASARGSHPDDAEPLNEVCARHTVSVVGDGD